MPLKLACPLSIYPFPQEQWNNLPASVFSEHCSLDTFNAHVSCLNHLPVYNPNFNFFSFSLIIYICIYIFFLFVFFLLTIPDNDQMFGVGCTWLASQLENQQALGFHSNNHFQYGVVTVILK